MNGQEGRNDRKQELEYRNVVSGGGLNTREQRANTAGGNKFVRSTRWFTNVANRMSYRSHYRLGGI